MEEMDHATTIRNIDPALHQRGVGFAVTVLDDPITQTVLANSRRVQTAHPIIMPVKADIVGFRHIIVGEVTAAAAEKHPRARGVAVAGDCGAQSALAQQLTHLIAGRRVSPRRVAQDYGLDPWRGGESFPDLARLIAEHRPRKDDLIADNLQLHRQRRCRRERRHHDRQESGKRSASGIAPRRCFVMSIRVAAGGS